MVFRSRAYSGPRLCAGWVLPVGQSHTSNTAVFYVSPLRMLLRLGVLVSTLVLILKRFFFRFFRNKLFVRDQGPELQYLLKVKEDFS